MIAELTDEVTLAMESATKEGCDERLAAALKSVVEECKGLAATLCKGMLTRFAAAAAEAFTIASMTSLSFSAFEDECKPEAWLKIVNSPGAKALRNN